MDREAVPVILQMDKLDDLPKTMQLLDIGICFVYEIILLKMFIPISR